MPHLYGVGKAKQINTVRPGGKGRHRGTNTAPSRMQAGRSHHGAEGDKTALVKQTRQLPEQFLKGDMQRRSFYTQSREIV